MMDGAGATRETTFRATARGREVSARVVSPPGAWAVYVLAHGAGAGMRHPFLERTAGVLAEAGVATFRFQFPYTEAGARRPDPAGVLEETVRSAVREAAAVCPGLPLFAGGKSMGGRMTSQAQAKEALDGVRALIFLGFPLHGPGKPAVSRAQHLAEVKLPMLFVQGTRDDLANIDLVRGVCAGLGARASLHVVHGGDHSFRVPKGSGRDESGVMIEVRDAVVAFMRGAGAL
jgi:hypothetical protein